LGRESAWISTDRRIAGRVLTVKLDRAEGRANTRHLCTAAIESADPGDILVIEQRTGLDAASWGGNLSLGAKVRGVAGVIVEGPVRDIDDSRRLDFPVFARNATAKTARGRIVEVATNQPIQVGDIIVSPGDYAIADASAVVFIAAAEIERVIETAEQIMAREEAMAQAIREGHDGRDRAMNATRFALRNRSVVLVLTGFAVTISRSGAVPTSRIGQQVVSVSVVSFVRSSGRDSLSTTRRETMTHVVVRERSSVVMVSPTFS